MPLTVRLILAFSTLDVHMIMKSDFSETFVFEVVMSTEKSVPVNKG